MALIKHMGLRMAAASGLFTMARYLTRHRVRIFAYHGVSRDVDPALNFDGFFVHPDVFEKHLRTLKGHYRVMPLSEIVQALTEGRTLPNGASAITFDDGYANNYTEAAPLLARYELPATFFVTTGFVDGTHKPWWFEIRDAGFEMRDTGYEAWCIDVEKSLKNTSSLERQRRLSDILSRIPDHASRIPSFMTWSHLRELVTQGHDIGAHTVSHISLGHESPDVVEREITESLACVRAEIGGVCPVYSYPYGEASHLTPELADVLKENDCIGGLTTLEGMNLPGADPFQLERLNVTGRHDRYAFRALASGLTSLVKGT